MKIYRTAFQWNETYDTTAHWIDIIKQLGYIVYDIAPNGAAYCEYAISKRVVKKYKGKEV